MTDGSLASGDLDPVRQWLVACRTCNEIWAIFDTRTTGKISYNFKECRKNETLFQSLTHFPLSPIRLLVVNLQFLAQEWFPFRSITSCLEDGSGRKGTSLTTSCCGV